MNLILKLKNNPKFRQLTPNERYLLLIIYSSEELRYTISDLTQLSDIHRPNVYKYVHNLANLDFIDLCLFGNVTEVLKK